MEASELPVLDEVNVAEAAAAGGAESVYVVQQAGTYDEAGAPMEGRWEDVATVSVPQRSKRRGVLQAALEAAGIIIGPGETLRFRVLDAAAAEVLEVRNESVTKLVIE